MSGVMSWAGVLALLGVALSVLIAPLVPALLEWWRPTDTNPLPIGQHDTLDPPCLARSFAARLAEALALRQRRLGDARLARAPTHGRHWPLRGRELRERRSWRLWHAEADLEAPEGIDMMAEVAAPGALRTSARCLYRAVWAGGALHVAERVTLLRWGHGRQVRVSAGARLVGRLSADESIFLRGEVRFSLLHAPSIGFGVEPSARVLEGSAAADAPLPDAPGLPAQVEWSEVARRGRADASLVLAPHSAWDGDLVGRGDLTLGWGCHAGGSLKARGELRAGPRTSVGGNVVAGGAITVGKWSAVAGSVISEVAIVLDDGCVVGRPEAPATVVAPVVEIGHGVVVHGTVWARDRGRSSREVVPWEVATMLERDVEASASSDSAAPGMRPARAAGPVS